MQKGPNKRAESAGFPGAPDAMPPADEMLREMCNLIRHDDTEDNMRSLLTAALLYRTPDADVLLSALTEEDRQVLRLRMYRDCMATAIQDLQTRTPPNVENWHFLEFYYRAFQLLGPPAEEDASYLSSMALLCVALDKHREAQEYLRRLLAEKPEDAFANAALPVVSDCISLPRFRVSFLTRCRMAWLTASSILEDYCNGKEEAQEVEDGVSMVFRVWTGLDVLTFCRSPKGGVLEFSLYDWERSYYLSLRSLDIWHDEMPTSFQKAWEAQIGDSPLMDVPMEDGSLLDFRDIQTALVRDKERKGVHLKLYHPVLAPYAASPKLRKALTKNVSSYMNGADFCVYILDVEVLSVKPDNITGTIATVSQQVADLGYTMDLPQVEIENTRMLQTFERKPKEGVISHLRDDILVGATCCMPLQTEYEANQTDTADYYMERGIAPCFIAWPRFILDCDEMTFSERLVDALLDSQIPYNGKILGRAFGTQYCYLDLLVYDTFEIVQFIEKYFARIPGGDTVRIQSFYYDAQPCPVSRAYLREHSKWSYDGTPILYDTFPEAVRTAPPKKPSKKKNAAKAKRKHSKKFH